MKSQNVVLISCVVAVVFWLLATFFEDDERWMPKTMDVTAPSEFNQARPDTPLRTNTDAASCERAEALIVEQVEAARYCQVDDDCTLFDYGYPVQCLTSVAKSSITELRLDYLQYQNSCEYRVYYDCPTGDMQRTPVCQNNRCEVVLESNDPLQQETLYHLGIEDN